MKNTPPAYIKTITEFHKFRRLPPPQHPLISVIDYASVNHRAEDNGISWTLDFYSISMKRMASGKKLRYGQQEYDFNEGVLFFLAPHQVFSVSVDTTVSADSSGWILLIHPDFIWNTPLAKSIGQYDYFDYAVSEALFLSEKEEITVNGIVENIKQELDANIDRFSQNIIISHIETLLNYSERFYERQFITRKISNHQVLARLEDLLSTYFDDDNLSIKGLPTVQYIADNLNVSPNYLSRLLKTLTGQSTQQFIHDKLIARAKEQLSTTNLTVNEIAYALGFEHPQSFSKLFKSKTQLSPLEFRQSFN
ncbi:AraC family transcriptional regulator [Mucilaginibacter limnophilus]|uniref:AraC family transcriptional regulator n=1 Tax=Mucilaginibacter limnophilus TaxID=1932778 RepID=A0A3S2URH8_9SPHI|nr:helix-turn-helix transcriptional regulator [Mucilaginibacter limnophilus]RVU02879.1 AraC family transcriptional regulator [Mucilaginibacter limnophilus]